VKCALEMDKYNRPTTGASIPWGNEAEIFIIAILSGNKFFAILRGKNFFFILRGEMLVDERLGDFLGGNVNI